MNTSKEKESRWSRVLLFREQWIRRDHAVLLRFSTAKQSDRADKGKQCLSIYRVINLSIRNEEVDVAHNIINYRLLKKRQQVMKCTQH